jgi:hypothetical protein
MENKDIPCWCKSEDMGFMRCKGMEDEEKCKEYAKCKHYNPKMTFFEAWQKAEEGGLISHGKQFFTVKKNSTVLMTSLNFEVLTERLFEKEWTIIPKKKKVTKTIEIPENATNQTVHYREGFQEFYLSNVGKMEKVTYDLPLE